MNIISKYRRVEAFLKLIKEYNVKTFVEVGVRECFLSEDILSNTDESIKLIGIDNIEHPLCKSFRLKYPTRFEFILDTSPKCANRYADNSLDFVHLDNNHEYSHVLKELPIWYKKVKNQGIFSGHDFLEFYCPGEGQFGVIQAVMEFTERYNLQFYVNGCESSDRNIIKEYGISHGKECSKYINKLPNNYFDIPNWWLIKEKDIEI